MWLSHRYGKVCTYQWSRFAKEYGAIQHEIALISVLCPSYGKAGWDTYMSVVMKCWKRGQRRKNRIHAEKVKVVVENGGAEMTRKAVI